MRMVQQPSGAAMSFTPVFNISGLELRVEFRDGLTDPRCDARTPIEGWIDCASGVMLIERRLSASFAVRTIMHEFSHGFALVHHKADPEDAEHVADYSANAIHCFIENVTRNFGDVAAFRQWVESSVQRPQPIRIPPPRSLSRA